MSDNQRRTCSSCSVNLPVTEFNIMRTGNPTKTCKNCLNHQKQSRERNKCSHTRQRSKCIDCQGSQMCNHNRQRDQCKVCSDPIKITIQNMIKGSKCKDKKLDRYDANNFIDYCFMEQLIEDEGRTCCYCEVELQYVEHNKTLATIERIDNSIGHTKANVRIACLECNTRRVGQRISETS